jgi:uncharacterized protein (TIGR02271 family)
MISREHAHRLVGLDVYDHDGDKIGSIGQVWADAAGQPAWASVRTGLFGMKESFVPLQNADIADDKVTVPLEKRLVKDAPNVDVSHDEPLSDDEVSRLYSHYGINWEDTYRSYQARGIGTAGSPWDTDTSYVGDGDRGDLAADRADYGTAGSSGDDAMTRSEERLNVRTEREQVGEARLRKYVVTEQQSGNVPVSREEVRLEREPITDANRGSAMSGPAISESEHEVALHAERPVVEKEAMPVERVRLSKETVTDDETVGAEVRKERVEADLPNQDRRDLI